jgi:hypothetical protein
VIIFGSRGLTSTVESGQFHCPRCSSQQVFARQQVKRWFTLYFIPIIPMGVAGEYIECRSCAGTFDVGVLSYDPAAAKRELFEQLKRCLVVACVAAGPPTAARITNLQTALSELTDLYVSDEELWADVRMAQAANVQMATFMRPLAADFTPKGKELLLSAACIMLSTEHRIAPNERDVLKQLGAALGMTALATDNLLTRFENAQ